MYWESMLPFILVLLVCMAACLGCGMLAARKGYNMLIWAAAGGVLVSFIVLAFLPYVNKESDSKCKQAEKTGNLVGAALAAVSFVNFAFLILEIVD